MPSLGVVGAAPAGAVVVRLARSAGRRRIGPLAQQAGQLLEVFLDGGAIVACMRKLLVLLNAILRTKTPWRNALETA